MANTFGFSSSRPFLQPLCEDDSHFQRHVAKRRSTPTTPKVTREMKPTSNRANQLR
jgi:hypothetical protein